MGTVRVRLPVLLLALLVGCLAPAALADDKAAMRARVGRLLHQAGSGARGGASEDAWRELETLGWERVLPYIDMRVQKTWQARQAALNFATHVGKGTGLYDVCLQAIRVGEEGDMALRGIGLLQDLVLGTQAWGDKKAKPRLRFDPRWWPELLLELHKTEVVIIEDFYSGPGWPAANLTDFLTTQIHGQEAHLIAASQHADWRVRLMAVPFLGATTRGRTPAVEQALRRALRDAHPKVRRMAVRTAGSGCWQALAGDVRARLVDPSEAVPVRVEAAGGLENYADHAASEVHLVLAMQAQAVPVRAAAAEGAEYLPRTRPLIEALLAAFIDPEPSVRVGAAEGLGSGWRGPIIPAEVPIDIKALTALLDDESPRVQHLACRILAVRGAVPATHAAVLAARLTGESEWAVRGAAIALGSLRDAARCVLPVMQAARGKTPGPRGTEVPALELERAIEAVEMAALDAKEVDALLAADDEKARARAVRELARRKDTSRLLRALNHADPEVAIGAAWALTDAKAHTEVVVDTVLRTYAHLKWDRASDIFHRLGKRLEPYVLRVLARYKSTPSDRWFDLLYVVGVLEPHLREIVWQGFLRTPGVEQAKRVAREGENLMPRVLEAFDSESEELRIGAAWVVANMRGWLVAEHAQALYAIPREMAEGDVARGILEAALREHDCEGGPGPRHPWIELR